jgi:hypothetical protein
MDFFISRSLFLHVAAAAAAVTEIFDGFVCKHVS